MAILMACTLCACKSEEAQAVDDMIAEIGEITIDAGCKQKIAQAEDAVAALEEKDAKQLENLEILKAAREKFDLLLVETAIADIGEVTLDGEYRIKNARNEYDRARKEIQALVSNYAVLETAEATLSKLQIENVEKMIAAIGTVSSKSESAIKAAKDAYAGLSAEQQKEVTNYKILTDAENTLKDLKKKAADAALAKLNKSTDKVTGVTWYQHDNEPTYIDTRSYVIPYIGKKGSSVWLRARINYTGDDWVFWKKLTIVADEKRYTKSFSYFDLVRDNEGGNVWEYVDFEPSAADIEMLKTIAASKETIIRFEGDERHYDLTVRSADKKAIREVLAAYEAIKG